MQQFQITQKQIKINIPLSFFFLLTIKIEITKGVLKSCLTLSKIWSNIDFSSCFGREFLAPLVLYLIKDDCLFKAFYFSLGIEVMELLYKFYIFKKKRKMMLWICIHLNKKKIPDLEQILQNNNKSDLKYILV